MGDRVRLYFSSSGAVPLSGELDPLFRSEVRKPPIRNRRGEPRGRIEHLGGFGLAVWTRNWTRLGSPGQKGDAVRIKIGWARWRFKADVHARFVGRMCAPGRPGEPQSTGSEQRRYCQEEMFCFHCFCILIPASHSLSLRHYARFPRVDFRFGTKPGNSGAKRQPSGMNLIPGPGDAPSRSIQKENR